MHGPAEEPRETERDRVVTTEDAIYSLYKKSLFFSHLKEEEEDEEKHLSSPLFVRSVTGVNFLPVCAYDTGLRLSLDLVRIPGV